MKLIRGLHNLRPEHRGCVATIGNLDGVHLGHQAVIERLAEQSRRFQLPTLVILFEPQPDEFFQPQSAPARLMRLSEKILVLRQYSVDRVLCVRFDKRFAALEPEDFIERVLIKGLNVRYLVVGDDFRFGKERRGDFVMLQRAGMHHGFEVVDLPTCTIRGARVSSTRIRAALSAGDLELATLLLGCRYSMSGRVAHGDKIGRSIGIPTANIHLHRKVTPIHGIFVVQVNGLRTEPLPGVASIGTRPTVGGTKVLLEVHLLDFNADIYGAHVRIDFLQKLRDEAKFHSLEEMHRYIVRDVERTRKFFAEN